MLLADLNTLSDDEAVREFLRCCGSARWARAMAAARPFASRSTVDTAADTIFDTLASADWLEAFAAHPRIGESSRPRARSTGEAGEAGKAGRAGQAGRTTAADNWSAQEQAGASGATDVVRERLAARQRDYEARFGYIFIICATGRGAAEMLGSLEQRISNAPGAELRVAASEQRKITHLRIEKLLGK